MCGIAGTFGIQDTLLLERMLGKLAHRGPDDTGAYSDSENAVALGHRRLAILDLSPRGHQPMSDAHERIWVTFNGEIYNYKELRSELEQRGFSFRSDSDTEVLIHGYLAYGTDIFKKAEGMWALALYDKPGNKLVLSRDPAGMKPLYIYEDASQLIFASEISALASVLPQKVLKTNDAALVKFLAHGYIYGAETAYRGIVSIPPASTRVYQLPSLAHREEKNHIPRRMEPPKDMDSAVRDFEQVFQDSVRKTLLSDVRVGIFLSGGIDSALVAHQVKNAGATLQAFTVGFGERDFDESADARKLAEHFGFPHTVTMMRGADVAEDVEKILVSFGQPFGDTSALPTYYVSKLARENGYKVVLTGDGADELFGGYPTHYLPVLSGYYRHVPRALDSLLSSSLGLSPTRFTKLGLQEKITRYLYGARLPYQSAHARWKRVFTDHELEALLIEKPDVSLDFGSFFSDFGPGGKDPAYEVMQVDFRTFLTSDCLVKSDIAAMQHAIETRAPFLNREVIDFAHSLPTHMKVSLFRTKKMLRAALAKEMPGNLARLPKRGFVPPLAHWLCTDLKPVLLDFLSQKAVENTGIVRYTYVEELINAHLERRSDNSKKLWSLMSLTNFFSRS